ncbi:MAG: hypothetical protein EOP41_01395 [Sphingobacteriaceae bacterium]|nr:MAG: hypothetical protein EOP41_01395 [Sphingobacteriaceae bacterium]
MKFKKACILFLSVILLLLINTVSLKAQGVPCGDPDLDCPIDGPVIFLLMVMLLLSVKKLTEIQRHPLKTKQA